MGLQLPLRMKRSKKKKKCRAAWCCEREVSASFQESLSVSVSLLLLLLLPPASSSSSRARQGQKKNSARAAAAAAAAAAAKGVFFSGRRTVPRCVSSGGLAASCELRRPMPLLVLPLVPLRASAWFIGVCV
jgi:hypothetical protein